jgi:hypothetical protein
MSLVSGDIDAGRLVLWGEIAGLDIAPWALWGRARSL